MSEPKRYPRAEALAVARELYDILIPFCERCKVVGSLRRHKSTAKDVELLIVPKFTEGQRGLFDWGVEKVDLAERSIDMLVRAGVLSKRPNVDGFFTWGPKNKLAIHTRTGIPVDFFTTTEENWWVSLVVRTGGKDTNLALTTSAQRRGYTLHAYGEGVRHLRTGELTKCNSEEEVFQACGLYYLPPRNRK